MENTTPVVRASFEAGERASLSRDVTQADIAAFAELTGDHNPVHLDDGFARRTRFGGTIAHGLMGATLIAAVLGTRLPGPGAVYLGQTLRFLHPVRPGDRITAEVEVTSWDSARRIVKVTTRCVNQDGREVMAGDAALLVEPLGEGG